jgi:hypothetical protein
MLNASMICEKPRNNARRWLTASSRRLGLSVLGPVDDNEHRQPAGHGGGDDDLPQEAPQALAVAVVEVDGS